MHVLCKQLSAEWLQIRVGKVTASRCPDLVQVLKRNTKTGQKGEPTAKRRNYALEVAGEIMGGAAAEHFVSQWMDAGREKEPRAREEYEVREDCKILPVGFFVHDSIPRYGASPDGQRGPDAGVEFKCPKYETHLEYLLNPQLLVDDYKAQCIAEMSCTGWKRIDLVSFFDEDTDNLGNVCHTLPPDLQMLIVPIHRIESEIKELEDSVLSFLEEVQVILQTLQDKYGGVEHRERIVPPKAAPPANEGWLSDEEIEWAMKGFPDEHSTGSN